MHKSPVPFYNLDEFLLSFFSSPSALNHSKQSYINACLKDKHQILKTHCSHYNKVNLFWQVGFLWI
jgi:hypothetical protein